MKEVKGKNTKNVETKIKEIEKQVEKKRVELEKLRKRKCYLFFGEITRSIVEDVFDDLRNKYTDCNGKLDVVVNSGGGDIDAAFNLSMLFRRFGNKELIFIIPRWAKSAATLMVCGGDKLIMTPIAELGPLDPQIIEINPIERRLEQFSPLHIESTLNLIRDEFKKGNKELANKLIERLQFPLTLGSFLKSIEIGEQYLIRLLSSRILKNNIKQAKEIADRFTKGYADHGFCITVDEAKEMGLQVEELAGRELDIIWDIFRLYDKKRKLEKKIRKEEMLEMIKELPPELLEVLPKELKNVKGGKR